MNGIGVSVLHPGIRPVRTIPRNDSPFDLLQAESRAEWR